MIKILIIKTDKSFHREKKLLGCFEFLNLSGTGFEHSNLDIVSSFGFRISIFDFKISMV